jgi:hypothetical protein
LLRSMNLVYGHAYYRDKKVVGVFVRFSCAPLQLVFKRPGVNNLNK